MADQLSLCEEICAFFLTAPEKLSRKDGHYEFTLRPEHREHFDRLTGDLMCGPIAGRPNAVERAETLSADLQSAKDEIQRLREALDVAHVELACLVTDPSNPDFGPATRNNNPADAACLLEAYDVIRASLGECS